MVRIRQGWLVAALAVSVSVGACKKKDDNKAPAAGSAAGSAQTTPSTAEKPATPAGAPAGASDDLSLLPVDSEMVMGLNFAQLQKSVLWKKFVEPQLMKAEAQEKLAKFKDACGFDPITSITSMSVGMKGIGEEKPDGVFVVHGVAKDKSLACLDKFKAEAEKDGTKVVTDGDVITITKGSSDPVAFTFVGADTLVGVMGTNANTAGVKAAAAGGSALKTSPAFVEMYGKIKTQDSLWLSMNGKSKAFDQMAGMGFRPTAVFGSINVTDGLSADMNLRLDSPDKATQLATLINTQAAQIKPMVDKLDVSNDAADVKISLGLSAAKLEALINQFGAFLPH
jgi:hypothetical protein